MPASMYDHWSQTQKVSMAPILELNNITTRLCGEIMRQNLKAISALAQSSQEQMQELAKAKGLNEVIQCQSQWISETTPHAIKHAEKLLDTVLDSASEYREWVEGNLENMRQQGKAFSDKIVPKEARESREK